MLGPSHSAHLERDEGRLEGGQGGTTSFVFFFKAEAFLTLVFFQFINFFCSYLSDC